MARLRTPPGHGWVRLLVAQADSSRDPNSRLDDQDAPNLVYYTEDETETLFTCAAGDGSDYRAPEDAASFNWPLFDQAGRRLDCTTPWTLELLLEVVTVTEASDVCGLLGITNADDFSGVYACGGFDHDLGGGPDVRSDDSTNAASQSAAQADGTYAHVTITHSAGTITAVVTSALDSSAAFVGGFPHTAEVACAGDLDLFLAIGRSASGAQKSYGVRAWYRVPSQDPAGYAP